MNKRLISLVLSLVVVVSGGIATNGYYQLKEQNKQLNGQIMKLENDTTLYKRQYQELLDQAKKVEDERQRLQQELDNIKALQEKERQEVSISRGLSEVTYGTGSRVDVKTGITVKLLNKAFVGTKMEGWGQAFVEAEQKYEINAIFLAAMAAQESGWGQHLLGKNNPFGFGAFDSNVGNATRFDSINQSVDLVANALRRDYLNSDGRFYNGATPRGVNVLYSSDVAWKDNVSTIMNMIIDRATK